MTTESLDDQIAYMEGDAALPRANGELVFHEPWEGRAFGLAVAMHQGDLYVWDEFRDELVAEIAHAEQNGEDSSYYERWLESIQLIAQRKGFITPEEIETRAALFASDEYDDHEEH